MKWFEHDSATFSDKKIKHLILRHGAIGYAVYFHCLELIAGDISENKITFELEHDSVIIADDLKINGDGKKSGIDIVQDIMRTCIELSLFQVIDGRVFCFAMARRIGKSQIKNPRLKIVQDAILKGDIGSSQIFTENHGKVMLPDQTLPDQTLPDKENNNSIGIAFFEPFDDDPVPTKRKIKNKDSNPKKPYGRYSHVKLSDSEYSELVTEFGEPCVLEYIKKQDSYVERENKKPYIKCKAVIIEWIEKDKANKTFAFSTQTNSGVSFVTCKNPECGKPIYGSLSFCTACGTDLFPKNQDEEF